MTQDILNKHFAELEQLAQLGLAIQHPFGQLMWALERSPATEADVRAARVAFVAGYYTAAQDLATIELVKNADRLRAEMVDEQMRNAARTAYAMIVEPVLRKEVRDELAARRGQHNKPH